MTIQAQRSRTGSLIAPSTTTWSAATFFESVDSFDSNGKHSDYAVIDIVQGPSPATNTSAKWTNCILMHGTTTDFSNATAISGKYSGTTEATATTSQFVLPEHNDTAANSHIRLYVDTRNLERYIGVQGRMDGSSNICFAQAEFWRGEGMPDSATTINVSTWSNGVAEGT